jgi:outer membrane receptor protein involved in Fe transport
MRKILLSLSLVALAACADKLTGPEAQVAAGAHRNEAISSGVLVLVDGVEVDTSYVRKLDASTIESIEVLKGKKASERFGARAQNGVILVSLKQAK